MTDQIFVRRVLIVLGIGIMTVILFRTMSLLLLIFAALVFATILGAARALITRLTRLEGPLALAAAVFLVLGVLVGVFAFFGRQVANEFATIQERLPAALASVEAQLDEWGMGESARQLFDQGAGDVGAVLSQAGGYAIAAGSGLTDFLLVFVGAIFLAAQPQLYRRGVIALVPKKREELAGQAMEDGSRALKGWLRGQILSMIAVTILTFAGLWALGVPAALGLALIAGLLDFIPFVGPIIAAVPAILLAFLQGPTVALWTLGLYLLVQQIQGNLLQPLVQRYAVDVPPAVLLFAVAAAGALFGFLGILLSAPLTVVAYVMIQRLYVAGVLGKELKVATDSKDGGS